MERARKSQDPAQRQIKDETELRPRVASSVSSSERARAQISSFGQDIFSGDGGFEVLLVIRIALEANLGNFAMRAARRREERESRCSRCSSV